MPEDTMLKRDLDFALVAEIESNRSLCATKHRAWPGTDRVLSAKV